jgi:broad specificity phosphatase PhoE
VSLRVAEALDEIAAGGGLVVAGTHAGPIGTAARRAAGIPATDRSALGGVSNTSVTVLGYPGPRLVAFDADPATARAPVGFMQQLREDR